jgi:IS30 family transposase
LEAPAVGGISPLFCNPYHSWEKGTVENTIGIVRQYFPKGMDLSKVTQEELNIVERELNNRPRKKLGFYTPAEFVYKEIKWCT